MRQPAANANNIGSIIAKLVAVGMLLGALGRHPYAYYTLLSWVVCGVSAFAGFRAAELKRIGWAWLLGGMALIFNPLIPVHLNREIWKFVDSFAAAVLLSSITLECLRHHEREP